MPRPVKEGLDYFPHDCDALSDEKIEALRALHGNDGYAFYFILLERIYRSSECEIDISDSETVAILAKKILITTEKFNEILKTALKHKCFDREIYKKSGILTSNGIRRRASVVLDRRGAMRERYHHIKPKSEAPIDEQLTKMVAFYEENVGQLSPTMYDTLADWRKEYTEGWFEDAVRESQKRGKHHIRYIEAILERWKKDGKDGSIPTSEAEAETGEEKIEVIE